MARIAVLAFLAACDVGSVLTQQEMNTDAGGSGMGSCEPLFTPVPADNIHTTPVDPTKPTNAGQGCMTAAGCHNLALGLGAGAPEYSYAGTLYLDAAGTMPAAGATILLTSAGVTRKLIAGNTGNFTEVPGLLAGPSGTSTATSSASSCPTTTAMVGLLVAGNGNCNQGGTCHGTGAAGTGTQGPIHVP